MARAAGRVTLRAVDRYCRAAFKRVVASRGRRRGCGHALRRQRARGGLRSWAGRIQPVAQFLQAGGAGQRRIGDAVDRALAGVAYDPTVKRHDGGVAMFGHNFAGFAASHVTPGMVARGRAELKRYAEPLKTIEQRFGVPGPVLVAIWGQETSFGGDSGSYPTYSALATLAWDCRRAERYRAELVDALMLVERGIVQNPRELRGAWAGEIGQTQLMPSAYLMFATTPDGTGTPDLIHNSADALASTAAFLKGHGWQPGAGLGRRRAELRRHPAMEFGPDLRQDGGAVRRPAGGAVADRGSAPKREAVGRNTLTVFPYSSHRCPSSTSARLRLPPFARCGGSPPWRASRLRRRSPSFCAALRPARRRSSRSGLPAFPGFRSPALAFTLDEASLWSLTLGALAGVGLIVLAALAGPEAALGLASFASLAFGDRARGLARAHGASTPAPVVSPRGALCSRARRALRLCGLSCARLARSDDR